MAAALAQEARTLREALGRFATGVTIVTTVTPGGRRIGLTANSFTSVSLEPPLVLWSLSQRSANLHAFRAAGRFAVNVLSLEQRELCSRFAQKAGVDRFDGVELVAGATGLPLIAGALAWFECEVHAQHEAGDHVVFFGRVLHHAANEGEALIFSRGRLTAAMPATQPA